jgi:hypothetical protein
MQGHQGIPSHFQQLILFYALPTLHWFLLPFSTQGMLDKKQFGAFLPSFRSIFDRMWLDHLFPTAEPLRHTSHESF